MSAAATNFWLLTAPFSVLAFLAAGGATGLLLAGAAVAGLAGRWRLARGLAGIGVGVPALYGIALVLVGFATPERTIPVGRGKAMCEIDCHLVYSVAWARLEAAPGGAGHVVRLVTRFDETTIAPWRGNPPLTPNPRWVELIDERGRRFAPATSDWQKALSAPLRPGESYETDLAFRVPKDAEGLRLLVTESFWPTRLLLGHENAPFAGRAFLALPF
jgi:hypothetical protein